MKVGSCRQAIFNVHEPKNIISASLLPRRGLRGNRRNRGGGGGGGKTGMLNSPLHIHYKYSP
jgi:hypothetical protein